MNDNEMSEYNPSTLLSLLPDFQEISSGNVTKTGEGRLILAVLEDAFRCLFFKEKVLHVEAEHWVFAEENYEWPFSFVNCCAALGIDHDYLRRLARKKMKTIRQV